ADLRAACGGGAQWRERPADLRAGGLRPWALHAAARHAGELQGDGLLQPGLRCGHRLGRSGSGDHLAGGARGRTVVGARSAAAAAGGARAAALRLRGSGVSGGMSSEGPAPAGTILVTGGAGFIGSALCRHLIAESAATVVNLDKLTYAANLE